MENYNGEVLKALEGKKAVIGNTDLDGLLSMAIVQQYYGLDFGGWYDNNTLLGTTDYRLKDYIGVDVSFSKAMSMKSISNHVEVDCNSISCNSHINSKNYHKKSMFSTALLLLSAIDLNKVNNMTDEQMRLLLVVDSTYLGWFSGGGRYKDTLKGYLMAYDLYRAIEVLENSSVEDFEQVRDSYKVWQSGAMYLHQEELAQFMITSGFSKIFKVLEIDEPVINKTVRVKVQGRWNECNERVYRRISKNKRIMSNAMTYRNKVYYTEHVSTSLIN